MASTDALNTKHTQPTANQPNICLYACLYGFANAGHKWVMNRLLNGSPALQYRSKVILPIYSPRRCMCTCVLLCKRLTNACLISVARSVKTAPRSLCTDIRCGSVDTSFWVCFFNGLIFHFPAKENTITQSSESRRAVLLAGDSSSSSGLWFNYPNTPHKLSFSSFPQTVLEELTVSFSDTHSAALKAFCATSVVCAIADALVFMHTRGSVERAHHLWMRWFCE